MARRYDPSKTHPAYSPPPRRLGTGFWLGAIIIIAAVILGLFLWYGVSAPQAPSQPGNATPAAPASQR